MSFGNDGYMDRLEAENERLRGALEGIAARRCLCDGHAGGNHGGPCCGVAGGRCVTCDARAVLEPRP